MLPAHHCGWAGIHDYAYWMSFQVTALPSYGGMTLCLAIGAVVVGLPTTCQTPLSGHRSPVFAVVPIGAFVWIIFFLLIAQSKIEAIHRYDLRTALVTITCSGAEIFWEVFSKKRKRGALSFNG